MEIVLRCTDGLFKGRFLYVNPNPEGETFGSGDPRDYDLTMSIEKAGLDPLHARILKKGDKYFLSDLNTSSGTWIKVQQTTNIGEEITIGNIIRIGPFDFEVMEGEEKSLDDYWIEKYDLKEILTSLGQEWTLQALLSADIENLKLDGQNIEKVINAINEIRELPWTIKCIRIFVPELEFTVGWEPVLVGSSQDTDITIPNLSPYQAQFCFVNSKFYLVNLDENTFNVYRKLNPGEEFQLIPGCAFRIGKLEFECCRYNVGRFSEKGLRPTMEDADQIIHNLFITPFETVSYYAVFDGHGGSNCADFLKENLHKIIKKHIKGEPIIENWKGPLIDAFIECDNAFRDQYYEIGKFMGSAAVVCMIVDDKMVICNLGDSRIILSQSGQAMQLSRDHKPELPEETKRIEANGGIVLFGRVQGKLAVSRAFGDFELKTASETEETTGPLVSNEPEIHIIPITNNDEFIVIGCDGLYEAYTNQELVRLARDKLRKMPLCEQDPQRVIKDIVSEATHARRTADNVTALLITLSGGI